MSLSHDPSTETKSPLQPEVLSPGEAIQPSAKLLLGMGTQTLLVASLSVALAVLLGTV